MDALQRRHVRIETTIATVLCSLLPTLAVVFLFEPFPVALRGADGLVGFALKSTLVAVTLMTTLMTLGTRAKLRKGGVAPLTRGRFGWLAYVPRSLFLRVPMYAIGAALLLAATTAFVGDTIGLSALQRPGFVVYNLLIGAVIGLLMTPLIQCAALADGEAPPAQAAPASAP